MLQSLFVQNYALIDKLEIDFRTGLSVITGETGAGKSILLGALNLALGTRADLNSLKNKELKCIIEAKFNINNYNLQPFFKEQELDFEEQCIIRREITPQGKSRAFVNDTPVNLAQLRVLGEQLIDIHSQHQNLDINAQEFQITFLDTLADNNDLLNSYKKVYKTFQITKKQIEDIKSRNEQQKERFDFIKFQHNELKSADLKADEQEDLEKEQLILSNVEEVAEKLSIALSRFQREEYGITQELSMAKNEISKISNYFKNGNEISDRVNSALIELEDIIRDLEQKAENINHDPNRLESINNRLNKIYSLQQKHNCKNIEQLLKLEQQYSEELNEIESFDEQLSTLHKELEQQEKEINNLSKELHKKRESSAKDLSISISNQLSDLGMPHAIFKIAVTPTENADKYGKSDVVFQFATDKTMTPRDVTSVASGGELSRIMLIIKSLIAAKKALPTLIFDEIDTGVSGEIANKMGNIMHKMTQNMQIITITHLPQIAAKGKYHYTVYKTHETEGPTTRIKMLLQEERVESIARMLSSDTPTAAAMANARELLAN